jgi:2-polyprenyl-6-methoxyphenol hydroxylase-like FAD-dependent oxidoreductase
MAVDVAVAGAGPGGLAAAIALGNAGHKVLLIEAGAELSKRWNIVDFRSAVPTLELLGWNHQLKAWGESGGARYLPRSLAAIENSGRQLAARAGVELLADTRITGMAHRADDVVVSTSRGDVTARYVVNASGGNIDVLHDPTLRLRTASDAKSYVGGHFDFDPKVPRAGGRMDVPTADGSSVSVQVRGVGNQQDGLVAFVDAPPELAGRDPREVLEQVRATFGISTELLDTTAFSVRHKVADAARSGRILSVGESVSRRHPISQSGIAMAVDDGARAAHHIDQALRDPASAERLLAAYGTETMTNHAYQSYRSMIDSGLSDSFRDERYRAAMEVLAANDPAGRLKYVHAGVAGS